LLICVLKKLCLKNIIFHFCFSNNYSTFWCKLINFNNLTNTIRVLINIFFIINYSIFSCTKPILLHCHESSCVFQSVDHIWLCVKSYYFYYMLEFAVVQSFSVWKHSQSFHMGLPPTKAVGNTEKVKFAFHSNNSTKSIFSILNSPISPTRCFTCSYQIFVTVVLEEAT